MRIKPALPCLAALMLVTTIASPAAGRTPMLKVHYGDLDLSDAKDRAAFDRRIRRAAIRVCGDRVLVSARERLMRNECRAEAIASAKADAQRRFAMKSGRLLASR